MKYWSPSFISKLENWFFAITLVTGIFAFAGSIGATRQIQAVRSEQVISGRTPVKHVISYLSPTNAGKKLCNTDFIFSCADQDNRIQVAFRTLTAQSVQLGQNLNFFLPKIISQDSDSAHSPGV